MNQDQEQSTTRTISRVQIGTRAVGAVSIAVLCSRLLGLIREVVLATLFADAKNLKWLDCYNMAFKAPNMLRDLFAEGALSTAFVTVFSKKAQQDGDEAAFSLGQKMFTLTLSFMTLVSTLGVICAPWIIWVLASGWRKAGSAGALADSELSQKLEFTILLARIMYPFILLVSLAALVMGILNARRIFFIPALSSAVFNLISIAFGGVVGWWLDPDFGRKSVIGFAIGAVVGGLGQLLVQLPALSKAGFRFRLNFNWRDAGIVQTLSLMWPAVISGSIVQVSVMLNAIFASHIAGDGPVTWLYSAFRLMQLPLGLFGVALATVSLPMLARQAADRNSDLFSGTLSRSLRFGFLLTIPSAVGLGLLAWPVMSLVYGNGAAGENPQHVDGCAAALRAYAPGLIFYCGLKIVQPAFYALENRFVPMLATLLCVALTAAANYLMVVKWHLGHECLAYSTSASTAINFVILLAALRLYAPEFSPAKIFYPFLCSSLAAVVLGIVCYGGLHMMLAHWAFWGLFARASSLGALILLASCSYFFVMIALGNEDMKEIQRSLTIRIGF